MSMFEIYLLLKLDYISNFSIIISCLIIIFTLVSLVSFGYANDRASSSYYDKGEEKERAVFWFKNFKRGALASTLLILLSISIPKTKEALIMYGGQYATNNEMIKRMPDKILKLIDGYITELTPKETTN